MIGGQRLDRENIQRRAAHLVHFQRRDQIRFRDNFAARAIHDLHARFHLGERRRVQHIFCFRRHRHVDGDEIRLTINMVQFRCEFRADSLRAVFREIRIVSDDAHPERQRALGDFRADAAHAQDAERLAGEFHALK